MGGCCWFLLLGFSGHGLLGFSHLHKSKLSIITTGFKIKTLAQPLTQNGHSQTSTSPSPSIGSHWKLYLLGKPDLPSRNYSCSLPSSLHKWACPGWLPFLSLQRCHPSWISDPTSSFSLQIPNIFRWSFHYTWRRRCSLDYPQDCIFGAKHLWCWAWARWRSLLQNGNSCPLVRCGHQQTYYTLIGIILNRWVLALFFWSYWNRLSDGLLRKWLSDPCFVCFWDGRMQLPHSLGGHLFEYDHSTRALFLWGGGCWSSSWGQLSTHWSNSLPSPILILWSFYPWWMWLHWGR